MTLVHMFGASSFNQPFLFPSISPPLSVTAFSLESTIARAPQPSGLASLPSVSPSDRPAPSCGIEFADARMAGRVAPWAVLNYPQRGFGRYPVPLD